MRSGIYSPNLFFAAVVLMLLVLVAVPRIPAMGVYPPALWFGAGCLLILALATHSRIGSWWRGRGGPALSIADVEAMLLGIGALVVDLRDERTFRTGHIRGCLHVPFADFPARFAAPDPHATRDLILVDESDKLSHRALEILIRRGFTGIHVMKGGMKAWRQAQLPLAK